MQLTRVWASVLKPDWAAQDRGESRIIAESKTGSPGEPLMTVRFNHIPFFGQLHYDRTRVSTGCWGRLFKERVFD